MATPEKLRVVFDCNVLLVAAAKERSTAAACLWLARIGYVRLFLSPDMLEEITDVLNFRLRRKAEEWRQGNGSSGQPHSSFLCLHSPALPS